jgi:LacI family transcriptional regulator of maltose regulon
MTRARTAAKKPTIVDVARVAGVSVSTASDGLNGKGRLPDKTRNAVLQVAREMGYEGNYYAQRLKKRCEQSIALYSLSVTPDVALQKILTIQQQLGKHGFSVPLHSMAFGDEERHVELMTSLRRQRPRAIIYCQSYAGERVLEELWRYIEEGGIAIVYGDNFIPLDLPCDQVFFDTDENIYLATRHLLEQGHRRVGLGCARSSLARGKKLPGIHARFKRV